ncbi:MAG: hypothetical protein JXB05_11805 [Myxococcaceae bacterium]|nr:hypothetical protein [Myxococcaceae bacterium]
MAVLSAVAGITAVAVVLTLPLTLAYLVFCYTDETRPVSITLSRREAAV